MSGFWAGGKVVTIPLAPRTARAIDLAAGERADGPLCTAADGKRLDRHGAARAQAACDCTTSVNRRSAWPGGCAV